MNRETQNTIANIHKNVNDKDWSCIVDCCKENAIKSHLIQNNGLLTNIAENGHLYEVKLINPFAWNKNEFPFEFKKVGINNALALKIFCNKHDTEIFRPIEIKNNKFDNLEAFLLFSYRAVCAEIRKKQIAIEMLNRANNARTLSSDYKSFLYNLIPENEKGIEYLNIIKKEFQNEIKNNTGKFTYFSYFYPNIEIYASAVFSAEDISDSLEECLRNIYIHILPLDNNTLILIGYHNKYMTEEIKNYCCSFGNLELNILEKKISDLLVRNIENWGLSISKYNKLTHSKRKQYTNLMKENINNFGISDTIKYNLFDD